MRSLPDRSLTAQTVTPRHRPTDVEPSASSALDDQALLGLMLGRCFCAPDRDGVAAALIDRFGTLGDIAAAELAEVARIPGI